MQAEADISAATARGAGAGTVLAFRLAGELFALPVGHVHEILDPLEPTEVPHAPARATALVNVRGVIVPLFDIRHCLCIRPRPEGSDARLVVIEVDDGGSAITLAFLADAVEGVLDLDVPVEPLPPLGSTWPEEFIVGVAQTPAGLVVLLDTNTLFNPKTHARAI